MGWPFCGSLGSAHVANTRANSGVKAMAKKMKKRRCKQLARIVNAKNAMTSPR